MPGVMYRITCASRAVTMNADRPAGHCHARLMYRIIGHYRFRFDETQLREDRMTNYLRFASEQGEAADVLVEVDSAEDLPITSEQNAGLRQWARNQAGEAVAVAQSGFDQAVRLAVSLNVRAFLAAADALEEPPAEMEITFGLKATGEVGNLAVGKVAGESNYQVKMTWRRPAEEQLASGGTT